MTDDTLRAALDAYMKEHPHWLDPEEDGCATGAAVRAALASAPDEGPRYSVEIVSRFSAAPAALDVERLAKAEHASYPRDPDVKRIEWADLSDAEKAMWRVHARRHAAEYAALQEQTDDR